MEIEWYGQSARASHAHRVDRPAFEVAQLPAQDAPVVVVPAVP